MRARSAGRGIFMRGIQMVRVGLCVTALCVQSLCGQTSWKGTSSSSWGNSANWTAGVPNSSKDAIIGDANFTGSYQPYISSSAYCKSLTLGAGPKASTLTVSRSFTVSGNIDIGANGTINHSGSYTISLTGNWTNNGAYSGTKSSSMVTFAGTTQYLSGTTGFRKLTLSAGSTTYLASNISVANTLTINGTLDPGESPSRVVSGSGALSVGNGGRLRVKAATFAGNYSMAGSKTLSSGSTVEYAASGNQTVDNTLTYRTLRISGGGVKSLAGNLPSLNAASSSQGNLYVDAGTLDLVTFTANRATNYSGGTISVAGGATLKIGGTNTFPANYAALSLSASSTVDYSGTNQVVAAKTYGHLVLSSVGAATKTLPASALTITGSLSTRTNGSGASVSFTASAPLTINGSVTLGAGTTFNGNSFSHSTGGSWTNNGTFNGSSGTVTLNGVGAVIAGSGANNFNNLTLAQSGITVAPETSLTVAGNLTTSGPGTFTHTPGGAGTVTMSGTSKGISGNGISFNHLSISGSLATSASLSIAGNLAVNGSLAASAGTIILSGAGKTISGSGTLNFSGLNVTGTITCSRDYSISGNLNVNSPGSFTCASGMTTFTGTTVLSGTATFHNSTLNGTLLRLSVGACVRLNGTTTLTAGVFDSTNNQPNEVVFQGGEGQTVFPITYCDLQIANPGTKHLSGNVQVTDDFTIGAGAILNGGNSGYTLGIARSWTNNGTFLPGNSTVEFNQGLVSFVHGAANFQNLKVNKYTTGMQVFLATNVTTALLDMTRGVLDTGTNVLTLTSTRTGSGMVLGAVKRQHSFTTDTDYAFESPFTTLRFASLSSVTSVVVRCTLGAISDFPFGNSVHRQYAITVLPEAASYEVALRLHYLDDELNGQSEADLALWRYNSAWTTLGESGINTSDNWVELNGQTILDGRWTLSADSGVARWIGAASPDWNNPANWSVAQGSASRPPSINDVVLLGDTNFNHHPAITSDVTVKSVNFDSAKAVTLTIGNGGSLTTLGNIGGNWTNNAAHTLAVGDQHLFVGGDLELSGGTTDHSINLNLHDGVVIVTNTLTLAGNATFTVTGTGLLSIGEDFMRTGGDFLPGNGTVQYVGDRAQRVAGVTYNQLVVDKSANNATLYSTAIVGGNLTLTNNTDLFLNANLTVSNDLVIRAGATFSAAHATVTLGGNWLQATNGTYLPHQSEVRLNGSGDQMLSAPAYFDLDIAKPSGVVTLANDITLLSDLDLESGTLDVGAFSVSRAAESATFWLNAGTMLRTAGTFPSGFAVRTLDPASTVEYYGDTAQMISAETYGRLILANGGGNAKTLTGETTVAGDLIISTNVMVMAGTNTLALQGHWTNNGTFAPGVGTVILAGADKFVAGSAVFSNLTVTGSYAVAGGDLTIHGDLLVSGSLDTGPGNATLDGDLLNSGSMTSSGVVTFTGTRVQTMQLLGALASTSSGVINFNGSVAPVMYSTSAPQFVTVNINNTAGISPSVGWTIYGPFIVASDSAFYAGSSEHDFHHAFINNGTVTSSGTLNFQPAVDTAVRLTGVAFESSGLVRFGGANQITLLGNASSFNDVVIANTHAAGITATANWNLTGDLAVESGAVFHAGDGFAHMLAGDDLIVDGFFDGQTSSLTLPGTTQISGNGEPDFYNLTIAGSGNVTVAGSCHLTANFTNNGAFDATGFTIQFEGALDSIIAGSVMPTLDMIAVEKNGATTRLALNLAGLTTMNIASGTFDTATFHIDQDPAGGSLAVEAGAILKLGGTNSFPDFDAVVLDPASTVEYHGSSAQTIGAQSYGNLTSSFTGARTLATNAPIYIAGTFSPGANSYTVNNSTVNFDGAGAQTIPTFNFHHLTSSSSGTRTLASGTVGVAGTFTPGANSYTVSGSTVSFNGAAQTIPAFTYHNLTTTGSGAKTLGGNATVGGSLSLGGGSFADGGYTLTAKGDVASTVTHTGAGKLLLSGGSTNHLVTSSGQFQNFELSDPNGAALTTTNLTVAGTLTLTAGTITTSTNKIIIPATATVLRTNGYVIGSLQKAVSIAAATNRLFEIGDTANYAPVSIAFTNVTAAGCVIASATAGEHPDVANSGVANARDVNRFWTLTNHGATFASCAATFTFATNDIDSDANTSAFVIARKSGSDWTQPAVSARTATNLVANGLTYFGDFVIGQSSAVPEITGGPDNLRVNLGSNATFAVTVSGAAPLGYQWRFNGADVLGSTNSSCSIISADDMNAGNYLCVVTNANGSITSAVAVLTINHAPTLTAASPQSIAEIVAWSYTNSATDADGGTLNYTLITAPEGASLDPSTGVISWTPTELQGPGTNSFTVQVSDDGSPALTDIQTFSVVVNEVNTKPTLTVPATQTLDEVTTLAVSVSATDGDVPATALIFSLTSAPGGMTIHPVTGAISWSPTEAQGPSTNTITVLVSDNGLPALSDTRSFTVVVNEVNTSPVLTAPADQVMDELTDLVLSASATDDDAPMNALTFSLVDAPTGMTIDTHSGAIAWTATEAQGPSTNSVTVRVTDDGLPALSDTKSFTVTVREVNSAPALAVPENQTLDELTTLTVTNTVSDSNIPAKHFTYALVSAPDGMTIDATRGVVNWTPAEEQGPSTNTVFVSVTDDGSPSLSVTSSFTVVVNETNATPALTVPDDQTITELDTLVSTNTANDSDVPANVLTFALVAAPAGMTIDSAGGVISWTPTEAQGPGTYLVTVSATDDGSPALGATNSFNVTVSEGNTAPVLTVTTNLTIAELTTLAVTNTATDVDTPPNALTFSLNAAPEGMTIDPTSGVIQWTPTETQGPSTNVVVVRVTDDGSPLLSDTESFAVVVTEANSAPVLTVPPDQTLLSSVSLLVTNSATDDDVPANTLRFTLVSAPGGMTIVSNTGVIAWSPSASQRPSTNSVTVRVTDNGSAALADTESFTVIALPSPDTTRPSITIISPINNSRTNHPAVTVRGMARDNRQVARVLYSFNGAPFTEATGTTNWSVALTLNAGTNTFIVKAVDLSGNESSALPRTHCHVVNSMLTVSVNGNGTVTPDLNGKILEVGRTYYLTALPALNWTFSDWSGGVSATNTKLTFVMRTNLSLTATFETNKFVGAAGVYNGLFSETNAARHESAGFLTLKLTSRQTFSGKIMVGGGTYGLSGMMNYWSTRAHVVVPRKGKSALTVDLQLHFDGSDQISGSISNADWSANLLCDLATFNAVTNPAEDFLGRYTMLLPGSTNAAVAPPGSGYGLISVASNGVVTFVGATGDGAPLKQSVAISKNGYWPLYVPLYTGPFVYTNGILVVATKQHYGSLIGWGLIGNDGDRALSGGLIHNKTPLSSQAFYPNGFATEMELLGSSYTAPARGCRAFDLTTGSLVLQSGNLSGPLNANLTLSTNNVFMFTTPNPQLLKLTLSTGTGLLKGSFANPANSNKFTTLSGTILQDRDIGGGFFLGTNQSGSLDLWSE